MALLQGLLGVEEVGGALQLAQGRAVARELRAVEARAQAFELVFDLAAARVERVGQRRVEAAQALFEARQRVGHRRVRLAEGAGHLAAEVLFDDARRDRVEPREEVREPEAVAFERAARAPLDDRQAGAVEDGRDWPARQAVSLGRLREVGDLGRAAEVGDGGQQVVLHDGAQGDVGAEALGLG